MQLTKAQMKKYPTVDRCFYCETETEFGKKEVEYFSGLTEDDPGYWSTSIIELKLAETENTIAELESASWDRVILIWWDRVQHAVDLLGYVPCLGFSTGNGLPSQFNFYFSGMGLLAETKLFEKYMPRLTKIASDRGYKFKRTSMTSGTISAILGYGHTVRSSVEVSFDVDVNAKGKIVHSGSAGIDVEGGFCENELDQVVGDMKREIADFFKKIDKYALKAPAGKMDLSRFKPEVFYTVVDSMLDSRGNRRRTAYYLLPEFKDMYDEAFEYDKNLPSVEFKIDQRKHKIETLKINGEEFATAVLFDPLCFDDKIRNLRHELLKRIKLALYGKYEMSKYNCGMFTKYMLEI